MVSKCDFIISGAKTKSYVLNMISNEDTCNCIHHELGGLCLVSVRFKSAYVVPYQWGPTTLPVNPSHFKLQGV
jgi:hypothetical protein